MTLPPLPKPNVEAYHYDKYQMHEYGKQCREAALAPDCRTCAAYHVNAGCTAVFVCTNGDQYKPAPSVVLWRTE